MTSRLYRDEAIILRTYKLGEADRIIVMLTRHHGQVRAVAKGVRRTTSRFGARLEPFSMTDVQLHAGRTLDVVTQAEIIDPFGRAICADYAMFTCASRRRRPGDGRHRGIPRRPLQRGPSRDSCRQAPVRS